MDSLRCTGTEFAQATIRDSSFADCKLDDANFRLAKLRAVRFESCVLVEAEFGAAELETVAFAASDLRGADVSSVRCKEVDLRTARLDGLKGVGSMKGATIAVDQLMGLAPALAHALGIRVAVD